MENWEYQKNITSSKTQTIPVANTFEKKLYNLMYIIYIIYCSQLYTALYNMAIYVGLQLCSILFYKKY